MSQKYNVDDILEEIRRKREEGEERVDTPSDIDYRQQTQRRTPERRTVEKSPEKRTAERPPERRMTEKTQEKRVTEKSTERRVAEKTSEKRAPEKARDGGFGFQFADKGEAQNINRREAPEQERTKRREQEKTYQGEGFVFRDAPEKNRRLNQDETTAFDIPSGNQDEDLTRDLPPKRRRVRRGQTLEEASGVPQPSRWQKSYAEQELLEKMAAEDEFASPEDAPYVDKEIKDVATGLKIRLALTGILTILSIYFTLSFKALPKWLANAFGAKGEVLLPLLDMMMPEKNMRAFLIVNLVVCIAAALVCSNIIGNGIVSLFRLRADSDSQVSIAVLAVLIQGIVLVFIPGDMANAELNISLYFSVAISALFFTLIGKLFMMKRVRRNFDYLMNGKEKFSFLQIQNRDFSREFTRGLGSEADRVSYSAPAGFVAGLLDKSYTGDYSTQLCRIVVPISFIGSILVGVITFFFAKRPTAAVSAFAAVLCVCAPFSGAIVPNLMLCRLSKKLTKKGAMLAGYESAEDYAETGAIILKDSDIFSSENVLLHGMKVFAEKRIDEAILDAASVILSCGGIMSGVFLNMIGGNKKLLRNVDGLMYEDGMGISAWVDGKRVLIGSSELMRNHEIECPSRDFESRYIRDGRRVLYIANSGELSAMFVVSYNATEEISNALLELQRRGTGIALYSMDPNITSNFVATTFGIKRSSVYVLPAKMHPEYAMLTRRKECVLAGGVHEDPLYGALDVLRGAAQVKSSVAIGSIVQLIGIIVGYGLVAFMAFTKSLSLANYGMLLGFQMICMTASVGAALFAKK